MKIFDSHVKEEIKKVIKGNKKPIIFGLILTAMINMGSMFALVNNNKIERKDFITKLSQDIEEGKEHDEFQEMVERAVKSALLEKKLDNTSTVFSDTLPLEYVNYKNSEQSFVKANNIALKNSNYKIIQTKDFNLDGINGIDDEKVEELAKKFKEYWDNTENSMSKVDLLDAVINETIKEMAGDNVLTFGDTNDDVIAKDELAQTNTVKREVKEITIDTVDFYSEEEKFDFICNKYNLTEFELKVIISVIYHEAAWTYDDAYRVTNVIYNRTKSKEMVRYVGYLTGIDGKSLYAQVIATSHGKDGTAYQQFSGYLPSVAGYDYEKLLNSDPDRIKLNGIFDFLISEESVHSFYSFKSSSHSSNDEPDATDWIRYTDTGNVYHNSLQQDDLNDENYVILPVERNVLVRKRG